MSVEGLWLLRTNQVDDMSTVLAPSVITLETDRLFGGDSAYFYVGDYHVSNGNISGSARVRTHTIYDGLENVFGMSGPIDHTVTFNGAVTENILAGTMTSSLDASLTLYWQMTKLAELPG
jgi:hypothetical protein